MQHRLVAIFLFFLPSILNAALNGTCVPWSGVSPDCNLPAGTPVFIPVGVTADTVFHHIQALSNGIAFRAKVSEPCYSTAIEMLCSTALRPCLQLSTNETVPYPAETCKSLCTKYVEQCTISLSISAGVPLTTCTQDLWKRNLSCWLISNLPSNVVAYGVPSGNLTCDETDSLVNNTLRFPENSTLYSINGTDYAVPCSVINITLDVHCASPLVETDGHYCSFPCPLPSLSNSEYNNAQIMQDIVSWISWVASAFLLVSFLVNPHMQRLPKGLILPTVIGANILAGGMVLPSLAGYDNIWCGGSGTTLQPNTYYDNGIHVSSSFQDLIYYSSPCSFQGAILLFGFLTSTFWWAIVAFNMFLEIYFGVWLEGQWKKYTRIVVYNIIGWGIPFLFTVIPASAEAIGLQPGDTLSQDNYAWIIVFFFVPVGICLLFGSIFFILSLAKLMFVVIKLRKWKEVVMPYLRVLLFIFSLFLVVTLFSIYCINNAANASTINSGYQQYYACIGTSAVSGTICELDNNVANYSLVMLKGFAISVFGVLLFFIFTSPQLFIHWFRVFQAIYRLMRERDKAAVMNLWQQLGRTTTTRSSSITLAGVSMAVVEDNISGEKSADDDVAEETDVEESSSSPTEED